MTRFEDLIEHLVDAFAVDAGAGSDATTREGPALFVTTLDLDLPVETLIGDDGGLLATLPRGVMATGFELPLGRLRVTCSEVVA